MLTLNTIIEEMQNVPIGRLEELYQFVHSLSPKINISDVVRKQILSYGGAFSDMSNEDYSDFLNYTKQSRVRLFDREFEL
ncbi:MAG: hypothetical protein RO257_11075 [Candidatus Kapabacteria bacterium]|nr:hypothetical protein [Candidatus Kapabacteria bacterium]